VNSDDGQYTLSKSAHALELGHVAIRLVSFKAGKLKWKFVRGVTLDNLENTAPPPNALVILKSVTIVPGNCTTRLARFFIEAA